MSQIWTPPKSHFAFPSPPPKKNKSFSKKITTHPYISHTRKWQSPGNAASYESGIPAKIAFACWYPGFVFGVCSFQFGVLIHNRKEFPHKKAINLLIGGWVPNPFRKICGCSSNWIMKPQTFGVKISPHILELPPASLLTNLPYI